MDMGDTVGVLPVDQWSHRHNIFWIIVFDGPQIAKFALTRSLVGDNIGGLHIDTLTFGFVTHEVNLACMQLTDLHFISLSSKVIVDDILEMSCFG